MLSDIETLSKAQTISKLTCATHGHQAVILDIYTMCTRAVGYAVKAGSGINEELERWTAKVGYV